MGWMDQLRAMFAPNEEDKRKRAQEADDARREAMMFVGRARLIVNLFDHWGEEASTEHAPRATPGFDPLLIFSFDPHGGREGWTVCTAGLSLCRALDERWPTELVAYTDDPVHVPGLVQLLLQLAYGLPEAPLAWKAGDTLVFDEDPPELGLPLTRFFGFEDLPEVGGVTQFPDPTRETDLRYVMARPKEDATPVRFLRVVPLASADVEDWNARRARGLARWRWHPEDAP